MYHLKGVRLKFVIVMIHVYSDLGGKYSACLRLQVAGRPRQRDDCQNCEFEPSYDC